MYSLKRCININLLHQTYCSVYQNYSSCAASVKGLVLGVYDPDKCGDQEFTDAGVRINETSNGLLKELLDKQFIPLGKTEVFSYLGIKDYTHIALAGLGPRKPSKLNFKEQLNEEKENIRVAMAVGARGVQDRGANRILVDGVTVPEAAAEGSILGTYKYMANYSMPRTQPEVELFDHPDTNSWMSGEINAECQNWARFLSHYPSNLKKPSLFAQEIIEKLCKFDVRVDVRNREWMLLKKMTASLSLTRGSCESPLMLELSYCGDEPNVKPIVLVGKGNICDSGGLFLKPYKTMHEFRADMAGAASICATFMAIARKRIPINIRAALLVYENMPSPMGLKPGDVIRDRYGTHIRISDPDNDCRVVLADIVNFTEFYHPEMIIDIGTFTQSVSDILGLAASGVFTTQTLLFNEIQRAALETGDRVWRLPLWKYFTKINRGHRSVDLDNATDKGGGDTCLAAAFLQEFIPRMNTKTPPDCSELIPYLHIDCFGTALLSQTPDEIDPYYRKGIKMGRPTRLLIQFLYQRACLLPKRKLIKKKLKQ